MNLFKSIEKTGDFLVELFHLVGLFVIGGTIIWSATHEYIEIMKSGVAGLDDILLLFIYLELGAMTGVFFRTHKLPVIFLILIAITALTRYLAIDLKGLDIWEILTLSGAILILTLSGLVLRYSEHNFSSVDHEPPTSRENKAGE
ncbi:MAG TPA: phosphate-starvation-inducible E [Gammaproteobacteria bacterium]|nr:phosphate-starvation-inducible E [Gammaproteobacteria bacterium]